MGGIVLVRSYEPFEVIRLPVPDTLHISVVHPHCEVSTAEARRLVKERTYSLDDIVPNLGNVAALVAASRPWRSGARSAAASTIA